MKVWSRDEIAALVSTPKYQLFLNYMKEREARPRLACSDCQFEYVVEDGHECDEKQRAEEIPSKGKGKGRKGSKV
jgi:hypothetical protein